MTLEEYIEIANSVDYFREALEENGLNFLVYSELIAYVYDNIILKGHGSELAKSYLRYVFYVREEDEAAFLTEKAENIVENRMKLDYNKTYTILIPPYLH